MPAPRSTRGARAQARHFGCMVRARLRAHPARTHCVPSCAICQRDSGSLCAPRRARCATLPACTQFSQRERVWYGDPRGYWLRGHILPPPIMARHSVLRHLHTHDAPGKAHPADAGPPDPLRRCEKNLHAMPIESDTSVLMASDFQGINPRRFRPRGAPARARKRTVPCSCTQAPVPSALRTRASTPSLHRSLRRSVRACRRNGRRSPVNTPAVTGAAAAAVGDEAATLSLRRPGPWPRVHQIPQPRRKRWAAVLSGRRRHWRHRTCSDGRETAFDGRRRPRTRRALNLSLSARTRFCISGVICNVSSVQSS